MKTAVYCATRNFYSGLIPAIKSLLYFSDVEKIYLLIEDDYFPEDLPSICETVNVSGQKWFDEDGPNYQSWWTYMSLMMTALTKYIPEDKVLYLDVDTMAVDDVSGIWDIDLDGYYCGGVTEPKRCEEGKTYLNTGVVLFNLKKLRDDGKDDEIIHALNTKKYHFPDQDVVNEYCQGAILEIDPGYNYTLCHCTPPAKAIIKHYAGMRKWETSPRAQKFRLMPWNEARPLVLFTSVRPLERAENIKAVYDAYPGNKMFTKLTYKRNNRLIVEGQCKLLVTDEYPTKVKAPFIMIGHGASGGKSYGLDMPKPYVSERDQEYLLWAISTSEDTVDLVARQSGISRDKVLPYGMPRTDVYFSKPEVAQTQGKRIYLYAPTFRNTGAGEKRPPETDWELIDSLLTDDEVLIIKKHMLMQMGMGRQYKHITEVSPSLPSAQFLMECDVLITDYSSIMLDAHIAGKPVVLFEKDWESYSQTRGMARPYPEGYASRHTSDEEELIRLLRDAAENGPGEEDIRCRQETCSACDGHSTERVVKLIEESVK